MSLGQFQTGLTLLAHNPLEPPESIAAIVNSPVDRLIGMLLERVEAVRELHDSVRAEADEHRKDVSAQQVLLTKLVSKLESHELSDSVAFTAIKNSQDSLALKIDTLTASIQTATTAGLIQKAQIAAGWKVIAVVGGLGSVAVVIFGILFNHKWL